MLKVPLLSPGYLLCPVQPQGVSAVWHQWSLQGTDLMIQIAGSWEVSSPVKSHHTGGWGHCLFWGWSRGCSVEGPFLGGVLPWVSAPHLAGQDPTRAVWSDAPCFLQFTSWPFLHSSMVRQYGKSLSETICMPVQRCTFREVLWGQVALRG